MGLELPSMDLQVSSAPRQSTAVSSTSLAPGFRFHPTDPELVSYYLKRKVCGKPIRFNAISETDIYKSDPWDLPDLSRLKSRDNEWYFFGVQDKKYVNGSRVNRATGKGYWKATGNDRPIIHNSRTIGMKKTLVFYSGRAPSGKRTNWVMHEYRLTDEEVAKDGVSLDSYLLCKILKKSGPGFKPGEQYGPFVEEEWNQDDSVLVPREQLEDDTIENIDTHDENFVLSLNTSERPTKIDPSSHDARELLLVSSKTKKSTDAYTHLQCNESDPESFHITSNKRKRYELRSYHSNASEISSIEAKEGPITNVAPPTPINIIDINMPPCYLKLFEDLRNEIYKISIEKESLKIEVMSARTMINIFQSKIKHLTEENEDLKRVVEQREW